MKNRDIVIAGYAETKINFKTGRSAYDLAGEALSQLLASTGIEKSEIDGLSVSVALSEAGNPFFAVYMTDALGLVPSWLNLGGMGGCSATGGVARAVAAIRQGQCKAALVMSADAPSSDWRASYGAYRAEFQDPVGLQGPPAMFGLLMSRYMHQYGLKPEALAKIAVTQREHALLNDNAYAKFKKPLKLEDYMASRMIADPLRLLDSVMFCDGANAVLVTTAENAKRLGMRKTITPVAYAEVTNFNGKPWLGAAQPPNRLPQTSSDALRIVERWSRPDAQIFEYRVVVEDPKMLTAPWTGPADRRGIMPYDTVQESICFLDPELDARHREFAASEAARKAASAR